MVPRHCRDRSRPRGKGCEALGCKGIYPNVDFYSGIVYEKLGIEVDLYTPLFAIARVAGWSAHWLEQLEDNRIVGRPKSMWAPRTPHIFQLRSVKGCSQGGSIFIF